MHAQWISVTCQLPQIPPMLIIPQQILPAIAFQLKTALNIAHVAYILSNMIDLFYMEVPFANSFAKMGKQS